ncbi:MAG: glycoside hydrolase family 2 protein, partial [Clostridia bacterium]|nr:glycoside hydrolase family 2 protein [Clostridia bacterium]
MERILLNDNWVFYHQDNPRIKEIVRLPHANVTTPFNYFDDADYQFVSVYENTFEVTDKLKDKLLFLTFEGAAHRAEVYVNNKLVTTHQNGYTAFSCDVSKVSKLGENKVRVVLDSRESLNVPPFGHVIDYMTYGGLYREAYIDVKDETYIEDVFVKTINAIGAKKTIEFELTLNGDLKNSELEIEVLDGDKVVAKTDKTHAIT